jgi:hypothetical protein
MNSAAFSIILLSVLALFGREQQGTGQDIDKILEKADKLLEEAKAGYEEARDKTLVAAFVDAGFKLEEARIKYIVVQEIGSPEKQKTAADRLRAVNQLGKLIHDGKVAISGAPAETPAPKPAAGPDAAPADAPAKPPPIPLKAVDVMARAPVPDAAKLRDTEKQVRELFKDQYAKKSPADRRSLGQLLLAQAAKSQDDPGALWVLCREAQETAIQVGDLKTALDAIELSARFFDVDALSLKNVALTSASKAAKSPEESGAVALALLKLLDELIRADQFEAADKAAAAALQQAKKAADPLLLSRLGIRAKEVAEAKTLYQSMKSVLETLAKSPDDPGANLETGKFLCFVKGAWDLGIRFLVKGSDLSLKALAEKELGALAPAADRAAVADGWWDLAAKEKSPLRKAQLQLHARALYEATLPDAPALVRARIEKRLEAMDQELPASGTIDLMKLIDVKKDSVVGEWSMEGRTLTCAPNIEFSRIVVPYLPPDEYDLTVVVERKDGQESFYVGLARGSSQFYAALDGWVSTTSGIAMVDAKDVNVNETMVKGRILNIGQTTTIVCSVRNDGVVVTIDGKKTISYKGNFNRLSMPSWFKLSNPRSLWIGSNFCRYSVSKLTLVTVSGQGKKLR